MQAILKIRMLGVRGALLGLLAAVLVLPSSHAQTSNPKQKSDNKASGSTQAQPQSESSKAAEKESASPNKEHAGGPQEGIKVHGHWVIDVRNPDGKLVTHREFENAYLGGAFLPIILSREGSVGFWSILTVCPPTYCTIVEPDDLSNSNATSKNLTRSFSSQAFVLKGSFTAPGTFSIDRVRTAVQYCGPDTAPAAPCPTGTTADFTGTFLSPGVSVVSGQIVQVTVTISFS